MLRRTTRAIDARSAARRGDMDAVRAIDRAWRSGDPASRSAVQMADALGSGA